MTRMLADFWFEPRPPAPVAPTATDRALAVFVAVLTTADALLRADQPWRPVTVLLGLALAAMIYWRRRFPFGTFAFAFGTAFSADIAALALDIPWQGPPSHVFLLLLPYSLFRWGAGREAAVGVVFLAIGYGLAVAGGEILTTQEAIGAAVVMLFPAVLGATMRLRAREQAHEEDQIRLRERERLARELHDTVAHHVSAIAIQAQAGQAVAAKDPAKAVETLAVIEEAASRTLREMRDIVGALRDGEAELAPQKGLADLGELRHAAGHDHPVELELVGDLDDLSPSVGAALYRMTQEAITNAIRHGKNMSGIWVRVQGDDEQVRLSVTDDGEAPTAGGPKGFGLLGLAERAALLGGQFEAGPGAVRGWRVEAVLPRAPRRSSSAGAPS